jgi:hypothetical protein
MRRKLNEFSYFEIGRAGICGFRSADRANPAHFTGWLEKACDSSCALFGVEIWKLCGAEPGKEHQVKTYGE